MDTQTGALIQSETKIRKFVLCGLMPEHFVDMNYFKISKVYVVVHHCLKSREISQNVKRVVREGLVRIFHSEDEMLVQNIE